MKKFKRIYLNFRLNILTTFKDSAIADRATLVHNDGICHPELASFCRNLLISCKMGPLGVVSGSHVFTSARNLGEDNTLSRIATIRSCSLSNSALSQGERKGAIPLSWERGRGEGNSSFAQQTEMNLSSYRPNVLKTSNKLDCFVRPADGGSGTRNDETPLVPQYLSALVPSKRIAFTKPSRGTSDSERRTIINGNRAAWLSAINGFLCFAQQNSNTLCRQSAFRFDCERCRLTRGAAFTLAEILITLGILGVVAAMTIPNVVNNNTEKKKIVKLKKVYSQLMMACDRANNEKAFIKDYMNRYPGMYDSASHIAFRNYLMTYFNTARVGVPTNKKQAYVASWVGVNGTENTKAYDNNSFSTFVANDGTAYIFRLVPSHCTDTFGRYSDNIPICGEIFVDLFPNPKSLKNPDCDNNCPKRVLGKDIFMFHLTSDGIVPAGISSANSDTLECYTNGYACTHWVLMNENMDYLHCKGLSGTGKHKCD